MESTKYKKRIADNLLREQLEAAGMVHFHARFLAMPKLMQAWFWSFGLTKTF